MRNFFRNVAMVIVVLITASEINGAAATVVMAFSNDDELEETYAITAINSLSSDISYQELKVGASEDEIVFPDELTVTVSIYSKKKSEKKSEDDASSKGGSNIENRAGDSSTTDSSTTDSSTTDSSTTGSSITDSSTTDSSTTGSSITDGSTIDSSATDSSLTDETSAVTTENTVDEPQAASKVSSVTGESSVTEEISETSSDESTTGDDTTSEPEASETIEDANQTSSRLGDIFKPLTVFAAEEDAAYEDSSSENEETDGDTILEDKTTEETVIRNISWKIDSSRSSYDTFTSEEAGASFVYVPQIHHVHNVDTELPTITVKIVEQEPVWEVMTLEKEGVKVEGNLPIGSELVVSVISEEDALSLLDDDSKEVVFAYDITIMANGEEVPIDETITVTITPPSEIDLNEYEKEDLELIHVTDETINNTVQMDINSNGEIEFETEGFSPYILTLTAKETDTSNLELLNDKYFSQSVVVKFGSNALLDSDSEIKLSVYGNIGKNYTYGDNSEGQFLISENTFSVNSTINTFTIDNIPVYIAEGSGDKSAGGKGTYDTPSDFYGILIETVDGYTPNNGTDENFVKLTPTKDGNDLIWTTSEVTIENSIMTLVSPSFNIVWQDNNNFAEKRPYTSNGELSDATTAASNIRLYYKNGDEYIEKTKSPTVTRTSLSTWKVTYNNLPKYISGETAYDWYIKLSDDFLGDSKAYYSISEGYLQISDSTTNSLSLTYSDSITGTINWHVGDSNGASDKIPAAPASGSTFDSSFIKFYSQTGNEAAKEVTSSYSVTWDTEDITSWKYTVSGLPLYAESGDAIVYYVQMTNANYEYKKSDSESYSYKFTYNNGTYSTDTDKCYSGQNINGTILGDAEISFDKVWYDDNDENSVNRRKSAINKGITLYLWRYPSNEDQTAGAPVTNNAQQYTYTFTEADALEIGEKTRSFTLKDFDSSQTFPKYDEMGYEYVYYVTEISESELYTTYYYNQDTTYNGVSTDKFVKNGGTIRNVRSAYISIKATKEWKVSAVTDYVGSKVILALQKKVDGSWQDVEGAEVTLTGFSSSKKKVSDTFAAQNIYDEEGRLNEFRVIEKSITIDNSEGASNISFGADPDAGTTDTYTAYYELNDYSYMAIASANISVDESAVETAEFTVTNKLFGTKELFITKTWSGDAWKIGEEDSKTGDISLTLYRTESGEIVEYADIVMKKSTNETEGTGTIMITYKVGDNSGTTINKTYNIKNSGKTWKTEAIDVPAYTDDGGQFTYSIKETAVNTIDIDYGTEYDKNITGKKIELSLNNYTGSQTTKTRIDVSKVWNDDSDFSQRSSVKVVFGYYDSDKKFNAVINSGSENNELYSLILSSANDYEEHIWIDGEDFLITDDEKDKYSAATTTAEQKELRAAAIKNHLSIKAYLQGQNGEYTREIVNPTIVSNNLTGGTIPAVVDEENKYYRPGYNVEITKSDSGNNFKITNTRFANRNFTFKKTWVDSGNILELRGDFLRVALFREVGGTEEEVAYIDIPTDSENESTVTFANNFPAYDEKGNTYNYSIKEYICTGTPSSGEMLCTDGKEQDTPTKKILVDVEATKDTSKTGYVVTTKTPETSYKLDTVDGINSLLLTESFEYTNQASGSRSEVPFYVIWHDYAKSSQRPDLYYTLYYLDKKDNSFKPYTGSYTEKWVSVVTGNKYIQKVVYTGLPTADNEGNVYVYYVAETLNNAASTYGVKHYSAKLLAGDSIDSSVVKEVTSTMEDGTTDVQFKVEESDTNKPDQITLEDGTTYLTKEGSFTLISIVDTLNIEGKKLWTNVPEGINVDKLPEAVIYLFRESTFDHNNKVPDVTDKDTAEKASLYAGNAVPGNETDGSASPRKLNLKKALYAFGTYNDDGTVATHVDFPKYDELGYQYKYQVREIIYNFNGVEGGVELPTEIMGVSYTDNSADLTNVYKTKQIPSDTTSITPITDEEVLNARSFEVTKTWDITGKNYQETYAKATFRLYRMELNSDGNKYFKGDSEIDDTNENLVASSKAAAKGFNIASAELVDERIIEKGDTNETIWTWEDYPIFAPSGRMYAYYVVEMTADMPGYTAVLNGSTDESGVTGATNGNTALTVTESDTYIGAAFANSGISFSSEENANKRAESFLNTYQSEKTFTTITFTKEWNNKSNVGNFTMPDISDSNSTEALNALSFTVRATASEQSGKGNIDNKITFTKDDYDIEVKQQAENPKIWEYTISFKEAVPVYSLNGNLYTYTITESLNSGFVTANYQIDNGTISASAKDASENILSISTPLSNSLKNSLTVSKRWDDYSNDYGMREGSIFFKIQYRLDDNGSWENLSYDGDSTFELNRKNSWKKTFSGLQTTANNNGAKGSDYQYRIIETSIVQSTNEDDTKVEINVDEPGTDSGKAYQWTQNGSETADSDYFYDPIEAGNYLVYDPADFTLSSSTSKKIVNQLDTNNATTRLTVTKVWADKYNEKDNYYGLRPTSIEVTIQKKAGDGAQWEDVVSRTMTASSSDVTTDNTWTKTFENLPKYYMTSDSERKPYKYRAIETKVGSKDATLDSEKNLTVSGGSYLIGHEFGSDSSGYTTKITNTIIKKTDAIVVGLRWNDNGELAHNPVTVQLYSANYSGGDDKSDESSLISLKDTFDGSTQELSESASEYTYSNLPKYNKDGKVIVYYVKEEPVENYKTQYVSDEGGWPSDGTKPTDSLCHNSSEDTERNTYVRVINTPLISIEGTKEWSDDENGFGLRPDSLTLTLQRTTNVPGSEGNIQENASWETVTYAELKKTNTTLSGDDNSSVTAIVNGANSWSNTIDSLPLYMLGDGSSKVKYTYRLAELSVPNGYELKQDGYAYGTEDNTDGTIKAQTSKVTNSLIRRGAITVNKIWNTSEDSEKKEVTVFLYSRNFSKGVDDESGTLSIVKNNGAECKQTINANSGSGWMTVFEDLPAINTEGEKIVYYIAEEARTDSSTGYYAIDGTTANLVVIGGIAYVKISPADNTDAENAYKFNILNTPYAKATVKVTWEDSNNVFKTRQESVYVKLQRTAEGEDNYEDVSWSDIPDNVYAKNNTGKVVISVDSSQNEWTVSYDKLPLYVDDSSGNGKRYEYRYVETDENGDTVIPFGYSLNKDATEYTGEFTGDESGYKNSYASENKEYNTEITNILITKEITVIKNWVDESNKHQKRPDDIILYVTSDDLKLEDGSNKVICDAEGASVDAVKVSRTNTDDNTWTYTISGLPKYVYGSSINTSGTETITYAVTENEKASYGSGNILENYYSAEYSSLGDTTTITNTIYENFVNLYVEIDWVDTFENVSDKYKLRPDDVTITIQRSEDGTDWKDYQSVTENETDLKEYLTLNKDNVDSSDSNIWVKTFENLPEYAGSVESGKKYSYRAIISKMGDADITDFSYETLTGQGGAYSVAHENDFDANNKLYESVIKNTLITGKDINVNKIWNDKESKHDDVVIALYSANYDSGATQSGLVDEVTESMRLSFDGSSATLKDGALSTAFTSLPKYNKLGGTIIYYVVEETKGNYTTKYANSDENGLVLELTDEYVSTDSSNEGADYITIVNTPITKAFVKISFVDNENRYNTRPSFVNVRLQHKIGDAEWEYVDGPVISLDEEADWSAEITDLPIYKDYSKEGSIEEIQYRFIETDHGNNPSIPIGYTLKDSADTYEETYDLSGEDDGYNYENYYDEDSGYISTIQNTLITKTITVKKIWDDDGDVQNIRPTDITIYVTEDTLAQNSIGAFNKNALGGVSREHPYGINVVTNSTLGEDITKSTEENTWTYTITGLPKYAYGTGATRSFPKEIVYKVTEDITTPSDNGTIIRDKYETTYDIEGDSTTITNAAYTNDGVLIIKKDIKKQSDDENVTTYAFPFGVTLISPNGVSEKYNGTYYLYNADDIASLSAAELRADAALATSSLSRILRISENGVVFVPAGKAAVLTNISTGCKYEVTESTSAVGYRVYMVENKEEICEVEYSSEGITLKNSSASTTVKEDSSTGYYYAYATGKITTDSSIITITNTLFDTSSHYLGIENVTKAIVDISGADFTGGKVKTYKEYVVIDSEDALANADGYDYVNTYMPFVEAALAVEFEPDTELGYTYADTLTVAYWENGDGYSDEAPHKITISDYVYTDADGNRVPYTGTLSRNGDGTITATDASEEFVKAWSPLLAEGTPYKNITILKGSVVMNMASSLEDMPLVTLVQVSFVTASEAKKAENNITFEGNNTVPDNNNPINLNGGQSKSDTDNKQSNTNSGTDTEKTSDTTNSQTDNDQSQTDTKQNQTDNRQNQTDTDQSRTESSQSQTDTKQNQTDDRQNQTDTDQSRTESSQSQTDTKQNQTDDRQNQTDTDQSMTDSSQNQTDTDQSQTESSQSQEDKNESQDDDDKGQADKTTSMEPDNSTMGASISVPASEDEQKQIADQSTLKGVRTGDETPISLMVILFILFVIAFGIVAVMYFRTKNSEKNDNQSK